MTYRMQKSVQDTHAFSGKGEGCFYSGTWWRNNSNIVVAVHMKTSLQPQFANLSFTYDPRSENKVRSFYLSAQDKLSNNDEVLAKTLFGKVLPNITQALKEEIPQRELNHLLTDSLSLIVRSTFRDVATPPN